MDRSDSSRDGEEGLSLRNPFKEGSARLGSGPDIGVREREVSRKIHGFWLHNCLYSKKRIRFEERQ